MPDIVILNGKLITMAGPDAEALAITNGRIEAVGTTSEIRDIAGDPRIIDAGGCTVLPGFIDSLPEKEEFRVRIPMGRYGKSFEEIASVVAFLASDGAGYITGQNIRVDGGITRSV